MATGKIQTEGEARACLRRLLTRKEAANYLGIAEISLRIGAMNGNRANRMDTPPYIKLGRSVRYDIRDLDDFVAAHRVEPAPAPELQ